MSLCAHVVLLVLSCCSATVFFDGQYSDTVNEYLTGIGSWVYSGLDCDGATADDLSERIHGLSPKFAETKPGMFQDDIGY